MEAIHGPRTVSAEESNWRRSFYEPCYIVDPYYFGIVFGADNIPSGEDVQKCE
jgi:hypothetical protein